MVRPYKNVFDKQLFDKFVKKLERETFPIRLCERCNSQGEVFLRAGIMWMRSFCTCDLVDGYWNYNHYAKCAYWNHEMWEWVNSD